MWKTSSVLIVVVLALLTLGIVMLASTSGIRGLTLYADAHYFVKRQLLWLAVAVLVALVVSKFDYHYWRYLALPMYGVSLVLLTLVLVPHMGVKVGGSMRWLRFGPMSLQASEVAKFSLILTLSWWLAREQRRTGTFKKGFLVPAALTGLFLGLILIEPDFGTTVLTGLVALSIMFAGGTRVLYLGAMALAGFGGVAALVMRDPLRMRRILAFLEPEKYAQTYAFQLVNAINAFISGGAFGVGLGQSVQKHFYLPESHTDFIFAIIGEELGVGASLAVVAMFLIYFTCGISISWGAPDRFGRLLAFGIALMTTLQAALNIAVVTGCMPTKGLPLPFISFGGTSLLISLLGVGVLVNIARHAGGEAADEHGRTIKDRVHRI